MAYVNDSPYINALQWNFAQSKYSMSPKDISTKTTAIKYFILAPLKSKVFLNASSKKINPATPISVKKNDAKNSVEV